MNHNVVRGVLICFAVSSCKGCFDWGDSSDDSGCDSGGPYIYDDYEAGSYDSDADGLSCTRCADYEQFGLQTQGGRCEDEGATPSRKLYDDIFSRCACDTRQCGKECSTTCQSGEAVSATCTACILSKCWEEHAACQAELVSDSDASVPEDAEQIDAGPDDDAADEGGPSDAAVDAEQ